MRFLIRILLGRRSRPDRHFAGRGAVDGGDCPDARSGENHDHQGAAAERTSLGRVFAASRRRSLSIAHRRREAILEREAALRLFSVRDRLAEGWTPEQISGWLKCGNEPRLRAIGCEKNSLRLHLSNRTEGRGFMALFDASPQTPSPASRQKSRDAIKDRASIHDRPKTVESRGEAGHWEGDLIICKCTRPVLVLHERKSRVTLAARLAGKTAAETISVMLAVFGRIDPHLRRSITFDNDTAFAQHRLLSTMRDMTTWFCDAYASWQKGGVENANGRLRRWLPRHLDIDRTSDQEIQEIVLTTNLTPRKCLGFKTPLQALLAELGKDVQIRFS